MWEKVASRLHTAHKIFPFGKGSTEVMLFGVVAVSSSCLLCVLLFQGVWFGVQGVSGWWGGQNTEDKKGEDM